MCIRARKLDRHSSALAIEALRTSYPPDHWLIHDSTFFFVDRYQEQVPGLGVDALIDVIALVRDALPDQEALHRAVARRVNHHVGALRKSDPMGATARLATLLAAASSVDAIDGDSAAAGWDFLVSTQHTGGSWGAVQGGGGTLTATANALRALNQTQPERAPAVRHDAYSFLASEIVRREDLYGELDVFTIATALQAIAGYEGCDYWLIVRLEDTLLDLQNHDGGWPERPGAPSSIEHTSLAVLALTAAGARAHVPTRLAQAALEHARDQLGDIGEERDRLQAEFETAVQERCGHLQSETARLTRELEKASAETARAADLEEQLHSLRRIAEPVAYGSELLADTPPRLAEYVWVGLGVLCSAVAATVVVLLATGSVEPNLASSTVAITSTILAVGFALAAADSLRNRNRWFMETVRQFTETSHAQWTPMSDGGSAERLRALRYSFSRVLDECPPSMRTELVYILFDRFLDAPADVAARLAEQLGTQLGMNSLAVLQFQRWAGAMGLLDREDRRLLFDQIRRSVGA